MSNNNYDYEVSINRGRFVHCSKCNWQADLHTVIIKVSDNEQYEFNFNIPGRIEEVLQKYLLNHKNWTGNKFDPVNIMTKLNKENYIKKYLNQQAQKEQEAARARQQAAHEDGAQSIGEVFARQSTYQPELIAARAITKYILFPIVAVIAVLNFMHKNRSSGRSIESSVDSSFSSGLIKLAKGIFGSAIFAVGAGALMLAAGVAPAWLAFAQSYATISTVASFFAMTGGLLSSDHSRNLAAKEYSSSVSSIVSVLFKEVAASSVAQSGSELDAEFSQRPRPVQSSS